MTSPLGKNIQFIPPLTLEAFPQLAVPASSQFSPNCFSLTTQPILKLSGTFWPLKINLWKLPPSVSSSTPVKPPFTWLDTLIQAANGVESLDLDFYHVPVNQGNNLCRFSEYTPKGKRPEACTISVKSDTRARAHGEIRPIAGTRESLITRVTVDFDKNVINEVKSFPDLEIDGFAAVDPPEMSYDWNRLPKNPVKSMTGGNLDYENPLRKNQALSTPFHSKAPAPPDHHDYWMFRFSPIQDTLIATAEEAVSDGKMLASPDRGLGALMLWAYLPTAGLDDPKHFSRLGIPFNTFPRRFDDLLRLFSPLFDSKQRHQGLTQAPLINPNTEYLDENGVRKKIPTAAKEVVKLNEKRTKLGLPLLSRNRGGIIDWTFANLAEDLKRLEATPDRLMPKLTLRTKLKSTPLQIPRGNLHIGADTEINLSYALKKVVDPQTGAASPRREMQVEITPLVLNSVDLQFNDFHLKAKQLKIEKLIISIPDLATLTRKTGQQDPKIKVELSGIHGNDITLAESSDLFQVNLKNLYWKKISFQYGEAGWSMSSEFILAKPLSVHTALGDFQMDEAKLPDKFHLKQSYDAAGKPKQLSLYLPKIGAKGEIILGGETSQKTQVRIIGKSALENIHFYRVWEGTASKLYTSFEIQSDVSNAQISSPSFGTARFTTQPDGSARASQSLTGNFRSYLSLPGPTTKTVPVFPEYLLQLHLPVVGVETSGRLNIPKDSSKINDAKIELSPGRLKVAGAIDLNDGRLQGLGDGETQLGTVLLQKDSPNLNHIRLQGRVVFEKNPAGWNLSRAKDSTDPLELHFNMGPSGLSHTPDLSGSFYDSKKSSQVVHSEVSLNSAKVRLEDFRSIAYEAPRGNQTHGRLSRLQSGPLTISEITGGGSLWVDLVVWGFVRGFFPQLGGLLSSGAKKSTALRPDPALLTRHLPSESVQRLARGDFFRIGRIDYTTTPSGHWNNEIQDLLFNIHEVGGRNQFAMFRIPKLVLGESKRGFYFNLGTGDYWVNVFLKDPDRGGSFRFVRWPLPGE